jgi:hypothetical protein
MPQIKIIMSSQGTKIEKSHGSTTVPPDDVNALANFLARSLTDFQGYAGCMPNCISLEVEDFGDYHTSSGYTG